MRRVTFRGEGKSQVAVIEGMPRQYSAYHLSRDLDARLYLLEHDDLEHRFNLHIGKRDLTPAAIEKTMICKDIDSRLLYIRHPEAHGLFLFSDSGNTGALYITDERGAIVTSRYLHTLLPCRMRGMAAADVEYRDHKPSFWEGLRAT